MKIGYARVSTKEQIHDLQLNAPRLGLRQHGQGGAMNGAQQHKRHGWHRCQPAMSEQVGTRSGHRLPSDGDKQENPTDLSACKVDGLPLPLGRPSVRCVQTTGQRGQLPGKEGYWTFGLLHTRWKGRTLGHHTAGGFGSPAAPSTFCSE